MDFIAFDLESEFIFREFFAGLSNLTIKKCGRGCRPCDEAKQEDNKEGEPQQRFNQKTPCYCNLWSSCHKYISSKSLIESEPGMQKTRNMESINEVYIKSDMKNRRMVSWTKNSSPGFDMFCPAYLMLYMIRTLDDSFFRVQTRFFGWTSKQYEEK